MCCTAAPCSVDGATNSHNGDARVFNYWWRNPSPEIIFYFLWVVMRDGDDIPGALLLVLHRLTDRLLQPPPPPLHYYHHQGAEEC